MRYALLALALIATPAAAQERPTSPLYVETTPGSARVTAFVGGQEISCDTPCTLRIPRAETFGLRVAREGYRAIVPEVRWNYPLFGRGWQLSPDAITVRLEAVMPPPSTDKYQAPSSP